MLRLQNIIKDYPIGGDTVHALRGVSMDFRDSEFVSILGPSGCGKTTLLNIIGGLDQATGGDLIIGGVSTKDFHDRDWDSYRNHSVGFVFQSYNLIPHQTVLQNVELALTLSGVSKAERRERAKKALERVGLGSQLVKKPSEMSGGQMQRVAIARAIVNDPDIILADEPTGALDTETSVQVMEILKEIASERLVIMVTHNPELAERYSTRIIRMLDGTVIGDSAPLSAEELAAEKRTGVGRYTKRPSMSILTSFGLSFKNLLTKKGRTVLTAFAGSIGIIGIALIYAVSHGMSSYIDTVQQDTLSTYPLTIYSETADMTAMLSAFSSVMTGGDDVPAGTVREQQVMAQVFAQVGSNDLTSFKEYLTEHYDEVKDGINALQYGYSVSPQLYTTDVNGKLLQVNPNSLFSSMMGSMSAMSFTNTNVFTEMIDNTALLESQYDVLAGRWPEKYDELLLVLTDASGMSDFMSYAFGLRDQQDLRQMMTDVIAGKEVDDPGESLSWTYDELMQISFQLINASDRYCYNEQYGVWEDMSGDDAYMRKLVDSGETLHIVGIVCPQSGVAASALSPGIAYLPELTEHVIEQAGDTDIVAQQLADRETDVFSGRPFSELEGSTSSGLSFEDMISVDTQQLSSAFGVSVTEQDIQNMMTPYMQSISSSITADNSTAEKDFTDILTALAKELLDQYIAENTDADTGLCTINMADAATYPAAYLATDSAQALIAPLTKQYLIPADVFTGIYEQILNQSMETLFSVLTAGNDSVSLPVDAVQKTADAAVKGFSVFIAIEPNMKAAVAKIAATMTEAVVKKEVMTEVGQMTSSLIGTLSSAFHVDPDAIASAFHFTLSEEELTRLIQSYTSGDEKRSADKNLRDLGYSDPDQPVSIAVYLVDFTAKEQFIDFIDTYNTAAEQAGHEEQVISYTDLTGVLMSSVKTVVDSVTYVLIAFVAISLIVSSIMIGVITLISVQERTKEIGILRAIGASKSNVSSMFNAETVIIGLSSGLVGVAVTYLLCIPINAILHKLTGIANLSARLPIQVALLLVVISMVLTLLSGLIPSRSAARKDPVVALRTE